MGGFAGFGERGVGAVPAGMVGVVAGGASFTVAALAAGAAVEDDLVRTGGPVFVDEKICSLRSRAGGLRVDKFFAALLTNRRSTGETLAWHRAALRGRRQHLDWALRIFDFIAG